MSVTSAQCLRKYGEPTPKMEMANMVLYNIPKEVGMHIPALPNRIYCNKDLVRPLAQAFTFLIQRGFADELKTWDGCFNIRKKRGLGSLSLHSWGIAVDVNAAWNGLGKEPTLSPGFVKCFTDAGFEWGGTWGRKDGMHFQLAKI